jgi:hypothetical protein
VAAAKRKGKKTSIEGTPNHFEKMLEGSCPNHAFLVKHLYMDCSHMKRFLSGGSKKGDQKKKPDPTADDAECGRTSYIMWPTCTYHCLKDL